jgi:hypothetical protein
MKTRRLFSNLSALALMLLGLTQLAAVLTGSSTLRGIGVASLASPLPRVFTDVSGLETFASDFVLLYDLGGVEVEEPVTPELYQRLSGPYNRRNVYGAALSYGPRLPEALWTSVLCFGLSPEGPIHAELGIPEAATRVRVSIRTKTKGRNDTWILEPHCTP